MARAISIIRRTCVTTTPSDVSGAGRRSAASLAPPPCRWRSRRQTAGGPAMTPVREEANPWPRIGYR